MAMMELLNKNLINTTTMITVESNTALSSFLFDRNTATKYTSAGYNSDTSTYITITFDNPTVISNALIQNHNLKKFSCYYDGTTTNAFTPAVSFTINSDTSTYQIFNSVTVSSITLKMEESIAGGVEKNLGEFIVNERALQFERNPAINNFSPTIYRKQVRHEMPDGGVTLYNIKNKYRVKLSFDFITQAFHDNLLDVYNTAQPFIFLPFPTITAWDGLAYEIVWSGSWNFRYSSNVKGTGYNGDMALEETVSG